MALKKVYDRREPLSEATPILQPGDRGWVLPGPWCKNFPHSRTFTVAETHIAKAGYLCLHGSSLIFGWCFHEIVPLSSVPWYRRLFWTIQGFRFRMYFFVEKILRRFK